MGRWQRAIIVGAMWVTNMRGWEGAILLGVSFGAVQYLLLGWYRHHPVLNLVLAMSSYVIAALVIWALVRLWWRFTGRRVEP